MARLSYTLPADITSIPVFSHIVGDSYFTELWSYVQLKEHERLVAAGAAYEYVTEEEVAAMVADFSVGATNWVAEVIEWFSSSRSLKTGETRDIPPSLPGVTAIAKYSPWGWWAMVVQMLLEVAGIS